MKVGKHPRRPKKQAASKSNGRHICSYLQHPVGRISTQIMRRKCALANMSTASVFRIVTETLQKTKVAAKWVPHQMSEEHKAVRKRVAEELLRRYEAEDEQLWNRIVAIYDTWIRDFEP